MLFASAHLLTHQIFRAPDGKSVLEDVYTRVLAAGSVEMVVSEDGIPATRVKAAKGGFLWAESGANRLVLNPNLAKLIDLDTLTVKSKDLESVISRIPMGFECLFPFVRRLTLRGPVVSAVLNGRPCLEVPVKRADGSQTSLYIDKITRLPIGSSIVSDGKKTVTRYSSVRFGGISPELLKWVPLKARTASRPRRTAAEKLLDLGQLAPDFDLKSPDGRSISLSRLLQRKQSVLLVFWFTNCSGANEDLPKLDAIARKNKGLSIVGVNVSESKEVVSRFWAQTGILFPTVIDEPALNSTVGSYRAEAFPTLYLVNGDGRIVHRQIGFDFSLLRRELLRNGFNP